MTFNVETATLQEAVDYSVQQIVKQGGQCMGTDMDGNESCMYGNGEGQHCAVGWLLDPEQSILMEMENSVKGLCAPANLSVVALVPALVRENQDTLQELQRFHDYDSKVSRHDAMTKLNHHNRIDTTGEWFKQWVDMGSGSL